MEIKTISWRVFRGQKERRGSWEAFVAARWQRSFSPGQAGGSRTSPWFPVTAIPGSCQLPGIAGNSSAPSGQGREGRYLQPLITACSHSPLLKKWKLLITQSAQSRAVERNRFSKAQIDVLVALSVRKRKWKNVVEVPEETFCED